MTHRDEALSMHLSPLSDSYLSDAIRDADACAVGPAAHGRHHARGLVRGLLFVLALALPLSLVLVPAWLHAQAADVGFAEFAGAAVPQH